MKTWINQNAMDRSFSSANEILVLLPLVYPPLSAKFQGPDLVENVNVVNHVISTVKIKLSFAI